LQPIPPFGPEQYITVYNQPVFCFLLYNLSQGNVLFYNLSAMR